MQRAIHRAAAITAVSAALLPAAAVAQTADAWQFGASLYGWFPDISGQTTFTRAPGGGDFTVGVGDILENLEMTFQGTFDARKGRFGAFADVVYMSLGKAQTNVRNGTVGGSQIPASASLNAELDMKSWIWTFAGYYRAIEQPGMSLDVLGGLRYTDVAQSVTWNITGNVGSIPLPDRVGSAQAGLENWDAIIGVRGRFSFGADNAWFVPYYLDIGTGESDFTLQAIAGIGYAFKWGEAVAAWRYLSYDLGSNKGITDVNFSGPVVGVTFRW